MRWSQLFIPTARQDPQGVEAVSHKLLLRGGYMRPLGSGVYSLLPLAVRVRQKIIAIIREEMDALGGQEFLLPSLCPAEIFEQSGRLEGMGEIMFRLRDRKRQEMVLGVTHEEIFATIAARDLSSYRQLPQIWYQFQTKFRDEPRPRGGLLRVREFTMKDSYSFDRNEEGMQRSYEIHSLAYDRIFRRCGLEVVVAEADSGIMGGAKSAEFLCPLPAGEDLIVRCPDCGYAANREKAESAVPAMDEDDGDEAVTRFATTGIKTIKQLAEFDGGAPAHRQIKTLLLKAGSAPVVVLLRGDHELNPVALSAFLEIEADEVEPLEEGAIRALMGAGPGSLGAVKDSAAGLSSLRILADRALQGRRRMQTGANADGFHLRGVSVERDIDPSAFGSFRLVEDGDPCACCGGSLSLEKAVEVGHIFQLGKRYSEALGVAVADESGARQAVFMGSYGIGVERLMACVIESHHDGKGVRWPLALAPFAVLVTPVNSGDDAIAGAAETIYRQLRDAGLQVLLDDRQERAGVKFNDGDLTGIPVRVTVGSKIKNGEIEIFSRQTGQSRGARLDRVLDDVSEVLAGCS
ncbi:MAG: proline--tRNA ligase [Candidatus Melainabacteria bacterium]|nr:proline--tRNA ligase [Candidatus Melainabacteria bacterium]